MVRKPSEPLCFSAVRFPSLRSSQGSEPGGPLRGPAGPFGWEPERASRAPRNLVVDRLDGVPLEFAPTVWERGEAAWGRERALASVRASGTTDGAHRRLDGRRPRGAPSTVRREASALADRCHVTRARSGSERIETRRDTGPRPGTAVRFVGHGTDPRTVAFRRGLSRNEAVRTGPYRATLRDMAGRPRRNARPKRRLTFLQVGPTLVG